MGALPPSPRAATPPEYLENSESPGLWSGRRGGGWGLTGDEDGADGTVVAHHDGGEERLPDVFGAGVTLGDGGGRGEVQNDEVGLHPRCDIADAALHVERGG